MALDSDFEQRSEAESVENNDADYDDEQGSEGDRQLRTYKQDPLEIENAYGQDDELDQSQGSELEDPELSELSGSQGEQELLDSQNSQPLNALIQNANLNSHDAQNLGN